MNPGNPVNPGTMGLYVPGTSVLHRAPAGGKLVVLAVGLLGLSLVTTPRTVVGGAALVLVSGMVSRVGLRRLAAQVRPVLPVAVAIFVVQIWLRDWRTALLVVGALLVAVAAAGLVTLTTPTEELVSALVVALRPLRRFGVDPDRVALTLALTVRAIPVMVRIVGEVREARRARGAERSPRALAVPLVLRTIRHADRVGEALMARGLDD